MLCTAPSGGSAAEGFESFEPVADAFQNAKVLMARRDRAW
jgi:hypothetical protein